MNNSERSTLLPIWPRRPILIAGARIHGQYESLKYSPVRGILLWLDYGWLMQFIDGDLARGSCITGLWLVRAELQPDLVPTLRVEGQLSHPHERRGDAACEPVTIQVQLPEPWQISKFSAGMEPVKLVVLERKTPELHQGGRVPPVSARSICSR